MSMANKIGNSKAMLEPVQLEKLTVTFVMNQRNMLQKMKEKEQISSDILHIRCSLKWHRYQELNRKGLSIQGLLSGAMQNSEKHRHNDVKCQMDFIYKENHMTSFLPKNIC